MLCMAQRWLYNILIVLSSLHVEEYGVRIARARHTLINLQKNKFEIFTDQALNASTASLSVYTASILP